MSRDIGLYRLNIIRVTKAFSLSFFFLSLILVRCYTLVVQFTDSSSVTACSIQYITSIHRCHCHATLLDCRFKFARKHPRCDENSHFPSHLVYIYFFLLSCFFFFFFFWHSPVNILHSGKRGRKLT